MPDVPNWAWHDYGMRVGFWRLLEALQKRKLRATTSINAHVCESYEPVARAMLDAGWEFMAHGVVQGAMHLLPDQRAAIRQSIEIIQKFTGAKPKGWLGPGLTETWETLDYLAEEGIEYVSDWVNDDQPYEIRTSAGPLVSVPYTLELNDIPVMVIQHHTSDLWVQRCRDQFDRLYREGARNPRVMAIAVHPYISGRAAPDQVLRGGLRLHAQAEGRVVHDRRGNLPMVEGAPAMTGLRFGQARTGFHPALHRGRRDEALVAQGAGRGSGLLLLRLGQDLNAGAQRPGQGRPGGPAARRDDPGHQRR